MRKGRPPAERAYQGIAFQAHLQIKCEAGFVPRPDLRAGDDGSRANAASAPTHGSSGTEPTAAKPEGLASEKQVSAVFGKAKALGWDNDALSAYIAEKAGKEVHPEQLTAKSARALLDALQKLLDESEVPAKPDGEVLDMTGDEIPWGAQ